MGEMPITNPYSAADDATLVRAVLNNEPDAFRYIIRRYERLVLHIAFRMVHNRTDREDLCQEIFIRVHDKLSTFRFEAKLSSWIGRIAYNVCLGYLQKKKLVLWEDWIHPAGSDDEVADDWREEMLSDEQSPGEKLEQKEEEEILQKCIGELSGLQRTVLLLFHQDELSLEEIAAITDLPLNTVKSHLFRARKLLRTMMVKELTR